MKMKFVVVIVLILFLFACSNETKTGNDEKKLVPGTKEDKTSYSVGYRMGLSLRSMVQNKDISLEMALQGIKDATADQPQLQEQEMNKIYGQFKQLMEKRKAQRQKIAAQKNKSDSEEFLRQNAAKDGITVTKSGLQYRILQEGTGPVPKDTDIAVVHYKASLVNGKEVFSTYVLRQPVRLPVQRSLPAWQEALKLMKTGTKFILYIPPELAYKHHGRPPNIGPNMALIYEGELLDIEK